jgi:hypothetical protein
VARIVWLICNDIVLLARDGMVSIPDRLSEKPRPLRTQSPRFDVGPSTSREAEGGKDVKTKNVKAIAFKVFKPFNRFGSFKSA